MMSQKRTWLLVSALLSAALTIPVLSQAQSEQLETPHREIASIITSLESLQTQVETLDKISKNPGNEPGILRGQEALLRGIDYFKDEHYQAAIYSLNIYLNTTQVPEILDYLRAQFILGQSYENIRLPARATRAYLRYVAAYITNPAGEPKELLDVVRHTLYLSLQTNEEQSANVSQLLAALTSIELPDLVKSEIYLYAAIAANLAKGDPSSQTWLDKARRLGPSPVTRGTALFFAGVLAVKARNGKEAEDLFSECIGIQAAEAQDIRNRCYLSLARLYVTDGKPLKAIQTYDKVAASSSSQREAAFEKAVTLARAGKYQDASRATDAFLAIYRDGADVFRLQSLRSLLAAQAGALTKAKAGIADDVKRLAAEKDFIDQLFAGINRMPYTDVIRLQGETMGDVPGPKLIDDAITIFQSLDEMSDYLAELRNELRGIIYILGRTPFDVMRPEWENRIAAMATQLTALLREGERLAVTERLLYGDRLSPALQVELDKNQQRRAKILAQRAVNQDQRQADKTWADTEIVTHKIALVYDRLQKDRATLAAMRYALSPVGKKSKKASIRQQDIDRLLSANDKQMQGLLRALEITRSLRFQNIVERSNLRRLKNMATQVGGNILDISIILEQERNRQDNINAKYLAMDTRRAWSLWQFTFRRLVENLASLEEELKRDVTGTLDGINQLLARHDHLSQRRDQVLVALETRLADQAEFLASYYGHHLDKQTAKNQKWMADIDWLTYEDNKRSSQREMQQIERQEQLIKENLKDIEQGVR